MPAFIRPGSGVIVMKIGVHAQEPLDDIIRRKQDEFAAAGKIFWGYGGNTCHPTRMVQPFVRAAIGDGAPVHLVMHKMVSSHFAEPELAREYSDDGLTWYPIPKGIQVRGSRYAMVIGGLTEDEFDLNLRDTIVGVGPSRGQRGEDYIRGRVDKGCFEVIEHAGLEPANPDSMMHIDLYAPLVEPYAVLLR